VHTKEVGHDPQGRARLCRAGEVTGLGPPAARLFLALWPDDAARRALAAWRDRWSLPEGAAPVADERLHLTLHFIGAVALARLDSVAAGLAVPFSGFTLDAGLAERWPHGIAAWRPREAPPELVTLHQRLAAALRALDLPVEQRPFRPHVTLARKAAAAMPPLRPPRTASPWRVDGYTLVRSQGGYRLLRRYA
jgi:2'-5' RNA ligase